MRERRPVTRARSFVCLAGLFGISLIVLPRLAIAQVAVATCMSDGGATQWATASGSASGPAGVPDSASLERLLLGRFTIVQFVTEGVNPPEVLKWTLRITQADSRSVTRAAMDRSGGRLLATAVREQSAANPRLTRDGGVAVELNERFEIWLRPSSGLLRWFSLSGGSEGGAVYQVSGIDTLGFRGRWEEGGIGISFVKRGDLTTLERMRGYYCARRIQ